MGVNTQTNLTRKQTTQKTLFEMSTFQLKVFGKENLLTTLGWVNIVKKETAIKHLTKLHVAYEEVSMVRFCFNFVVTTHLMADPQAAAVLVLDFMI